MDYTKHIRKSYKKREGAPPRLGAGRLCGLLAAAGLLADVLGGVGCGWRLLAFLGAGDARRDGRAAGVGGAAGGVQGAGAMVCR